VTNVLSDMVLSIMIDRPSRRREPIANAARDSGSSAPRG